jgi:hypothetical protein
MGFAAYSGTTIIVAMDDRASIQLSADEKKTLDKQLPLFSEGEESKNVKAVVGRLVEKLKVLDTNEYFHEPVPNDVPYYHSVIKQPMDFKTISKKNAKGAYKKLKELRDDVLLIISNCKTFNTDDSELYAEAEKLRRLALPLIDHAASYLDSKDVGFAVGGNSSVVKANVVQATPVSSRTAEERGFVPVKRSQVTSSEEEQKKKPRVSRGPSTHAPTATSRALPTPSKNASDSQKTTAASRPDYVSLEEIIKARRNPDYADPKKYVHLHAPFETREPNPTFFDVIELFGKSREMELSNLLNTGSSLVPYLRVQDLDGIPLPEKFPALETMQSFVKNSPAMKLTHEKVAFLAGFSSLDMNLEKENDPFRIKVSPKYQELAESLQEFDITADYILKYCKSRFS